VSNGIDFDSFIRQFGQIRLTTMRRTYGNFSTTMSERAAIGM